MSVITVYSFLVQASMFVMAGCIQKERMQEIAAFRATYVEHLLDTAFIVVHLPVFLVPVTHWLEMRKMINYVNSWSVLQSDYNRLIQKELSLNLKRRVSVMLGLMALMLIVLEIDGFLVIRGLQKWWHGIPFGFSVTLCVLLPFNWTSICRALVFTAKEIMDDMQTHMANLHSGASDKLNQYRKLWLKLSYQTQGLGYCCGITYGAQNLVFFTIQIIGAYAFLSEIGHGPFIANAIFALTTIVFGGLLYFQCNAAHTATAEVGEIFQEKLEKMEMTYPTKNKTAKDNIRHFLETITLNSPVISLCGFVDVNRSLLTSYFSATVTYLVVLSQFQKSSSEEKNARNETIATET
ncbi:gustatory and odorant receptor 24-like [Periplaneta americana]|uniref:gustatory and odorant receptor 24-like n=1 Tax=Periplaneta americana TaxID=6978 RepID=UPI0037E741CF